MPRTKFPKTKRNRDAAKEEKEEIKNERLREFDSKFEQIEQKWISLYNDRIEETVTKIENFKMMLGPKVLSILYSDFVNMDEEEINKIIKADSINACSASILRPTLSTLSTTSKKSKDDEEDSGSLRNSNQLQLPSFPTSIGRTPGPLSSAKERARARRSRSANGALNNAQKITSLSSMSEHSSRSKLRTPLLPQKFTTRPKAVSADRAPSIAFKLNSDRSPVLCRWARPGETIISLTGSPIVTSVAHDSVANVNIPTKNGMLSLRPKPGDSNEIGKQLADHICPETIIQIKQLQAHLNSIMIMADK